MSAVAEDTVLNHGETMMFAFANDDEFMADGPSIGSPPPLSTSMGTRDDDHSRTTTMYCLEDADSGDEHNGDHEDEERILRLPGSSVTKNGIITDNDDDGDNGTGGTSKARAVSLCVGQLPPSTALLKKAQGSASSAGSTLKMRTMVGRAKLSPSLLSPPPANGGNFLSANTTPRPSSMMIRRRRSSGDKHDISALSSSPASASVTERRSQYSLLRSHHHTTDPSDRLSSSFSSPSTLSAAASPLAVRKLTMSNSSKKKKNKNSIMHLIDPVAKAQSRSARKFNDSIVYLEGPQVYSCIECRTHLTTHDEIISKSFHGRRGRAYLFDNCVNVTIGPAQERTLMTGLHSVCDIFCTRCKTMVGWTYLKAYESSQKYKEGKFIVEKINLQIEESDYYDVMHPAGERKNRFRARSIHWGRDASSSLRFHHTEAADDVYEYETSSSSTLSTMSVTSSSSLSKNQSEL